MLEKWFIIFVLFKAIILAHSQQTLMYMYKWKNNIEHVQ